MKRTAAGIALTLAALTGLHADEGMWTFDNLPTAQMKAKYGFTPDAAWLDHVRLSTVRFPGGTGSFISGDGLVLTNHHVGHGWIERVSDARHDYVENGFVAADHAAELKVPGLELATLMGMENITEAVAKAAAPGATDAQAGAARRETIARLVKDAQARTGLTVEPVSLYQGGETWLYAYKIHKDVRLVMAPEYGIAAFGKDWDNFSFPRHDLDFSLFRVYEDGKPYHPPQHLAWGKGPKYGDLTLVVGHPGRTSRLETLAQMETYRDVTNPVRIKALDRARKALHVFSAQGGENGRQVSGALMGLENSYKVFVNETLGLKDKDAMAAVAKAEADLKAAVARDPELQASTGQSWDLVAKAVARRAETAREDQLLLTRGAGLLPFALNLARLQSEAARPAGERGPGYRTDQELERVKGRLRHEELPGPDVTRALLLVAVKGAVEDLGVGHPLVAAILGGRTPEDAVKDLMQGTRLLDPAFRAGLVDGGPQAILESKDTMVVLARKLEVLAVPLRKRAEEAQAVIAEHGARIAKARFKVKGRSVYPDATFTLRLSYGAVETSPANGTLTQPFTTFGGLYDRAEAWGPEAEDHSWALPRRWVERRGALNPDTHFNFLTSNDIIGGNSGSPMLDRTGAVVGLAFDGNIESNAGAYFFDPKVNRTVGVDAAAILAALDKVYDASRLVKEITAK